MDDLQKLKLQEATMLIELKVLQFRISLLEQASNGQQKDIDIPCASNSTNISAIPGLTATGKEVGNSLVSTGTKDDSSSKTLVKPTDFISGLRPYTKDIQSLNKSGGHTSVSTQVDSVIQRPPNCYYVVYNGPYAGIYTSWEIAKKAVEGIPNVQHKKFKTFIEAKTAGEIFAKKHSIAPPELKSSGDYLKVTFSEILKKESNPPQKMVSLGRISTVKPIKEEKFQLEEDGFSYLFKLARQASEENIVTDKFFTTDYNDYSLFNFLEGANEELVNEAFRYGLVKLIYLSENVLEISLFPENIRRAVKYFRSNVVKKAKLSVFLKIHSTLPIWKNGTLQLPFHIIQIGISKSNREYGNSKVMKEEITTEDLEKINKARFGNLLEQILKIGDDSYVKVNHQDFHTLVISKSYNPIIIDELKQVVKFEEPFRNGKVMKIHNEEICSLLQKTYDKVEIKYFCKYCNEMEKKSDEDKIKSDEDKIKCDEDKIKASSAYEDEELASTSSSNQ